MARAFKSLLKRFNDASLVCADRSKGHDVIFRKSMDHYFFPRICAGVGIKRINAIPYFQRR